MDYTRPKSRRPKTVRDNPTCQDCSEKLVVGSNWSQSQFGYKRYVCMPCWSARQKRYGEKDPDKTRKLRNESRIKRQAAWTPERKEEERLRRYNSWIQKAYGIDLNKYKEILKSQNGSCAICKTTETNGRGYFHVDHCHNKGHVRGLLCAKCNILLGHADDNINTLKKAINYLNATRADHKPENRAKEGGKRF